MRPVAAVLAALALLVGCAGGEQDSASRTSGGGAASTAKAAVGGSVVEGEDGRTYRVAAIGETLALDDVSVRVRKVRWAAAGADLTDVPPGTEAIVFVTLRVVNRSDAEQRVGPLQFWFVDRAGNTYLGGPAGDGSDDPLDGRPIAPGGRASGTLAFPLPVRTSGSLLVYRFADATKIAGARTMGLVRLSG